MREFTSETGGSGFAGGLRVVGQWVGTCHSPGEGGQVPVSPGCCITNLRIGERRCRHGGEALDFLRRQGVNAL
jgi:hypothetical protein